MHKLLTRFFSNVTTKYVPIFIIAILIDSIIGDPPSLYKKIPHPIIWIGNLISILERYFNHKILSPSKQKKNGFVSLGLTIFIPTVITFFIQKIIFKLLPKPIAIFCCGLIGSIFIAKKSLHDHVQAVEIQLQQNNIEGARHAVSQIVGRNTERLDQHGISRAAIESLAENFSDGVIAPIFWGIIGGLPGIVAYKAINTADSMIGHKTKRYYHYGFAAAKTDDYINLPASRLTAILMLLTASKNPILDMIYVKTESKKHNSPNAGWPEAAIATCLSVYLAGPRQYSENTVNTEWIGQGKYNVTQNDIRKALYITNQTHKIFSIILIYIYIIFYSITKSNK